MFCSSIFFLFFVRGAADTIFSGIKCFQNIFAAHVRENKEIISIQFADRNVFPKINIDSTIQVQWTSTVPNTNYQS